MSTPSPQSAWSFRQSLAFGVGLVLLPVFWVWWTVSPRFSRVQRSLALVWTCVWLTGFFLTWSHMQPRYAELLWAYPYICVFVTLSLVALLLLRSRDWLGIFVVWAVFGGVAHHLVDAVATSAENPYHTLFWTLALVTIAAMHLLPPSRLRGDIRR